MTGSSFHTIGLRASRSSFAPAGASVLRSWPGALWSAELPRCSARSIREKFMLPALGVSAPIPATAFDCQCDPVCELRIGHNLKVSMSSGRASFLGHPIVSRPGVEDHSTPIGSDDVQNLFAGSANGHG